MHYAAYVMPLQYYICVINVFNQKITIYFFYLDDSDLIKKYSCRQNYSVPLKTKQISFVL